MKPNEFFSLFVQFILLLIYLPFLLTYRLLEAFLIIPARYSYKLLHTRILSNIFDKHEGRIESTTIVIDGKTKLVPRAWSKILKALSQDEIDKYFGPLSNKGNYLEARDLWSIVEPIFENASVGDKAIVSLLYTENPVFNTGCPTLYDLFCDCSRFEFASTVYEHMATATKEMLGTRKKLCCIPDCRRLVSIDYEFLLKKIAAEVDPLVAFSLIFGNLTPNDASFVWEQICLLRSPEDWRIQKSCWTDLRDWYLKATEFRVGGFDDQLIPKFTSCHLKRFFTPVNWVRIQTTTKYIENEQLDVEQCMHSLEPSPFNHLIHPLLVSVISKDEADKVKNLHQLLKSEEKQEKRNSNSWGQTFSNVFSRGGKFK